VASLEAGGLGLSESIAAYERGVGLLHRLHEELAQVEARVSVLVRIDEEGRPVLEARTDEEATPGQRQPKKRSSRGKTTRSRSLPGMDEASEEA